MKKILALILILLFIFGSLISCEDKKDKSKGSNPSQSNTQNLEGTENLESTGSETKKGKETMDMQTYTEILNATKFNPTVYNVDEIKNADQTTAGSLSAWLGEVEKSATQHNDDPTNNSVINSPYHTLKVNGTSVPVYTARCTTGSHSFAWIDVTSKKEFVLKLELTLSDSFGKCVVLPESREVTPEISQKTVTSDITELGSYTYTFAKSSSAEVTDPTFAPLTVMVTRSKKLITAEQYNEVDIMPGYHDEDELCFTNEKTIYNIKPGFHDISYIKLPSNSVLNIEQGAYIKVTERQLQSGPSKQTAIQVNYCSNVQIRSRGLIDCGSLIGAEAKNKHVLTAACSSDILIDGLTIINSNTWTICAYNSRNVTIERNLLLAYRMYSDGIMMSECINSAGRYNFVRTGDDGIEFKGTGSWNGQTIGQNCVYEYNDLWTDKGAGYCLTWESERPMQNMIFRNNSVGFAIPTWANRNTAIDCLMGTNSETAWSNVTFENIEIYHVISPNVINMQVQNGANGANGGILKDITFKNITVKSAKNGVYAFRMHFSASGGSIEGVTLENVSYCGKKLTQSDVSDPALFKNEAPNFFGNITVK